MSALPAESQVVVIGGGQAGLAVGYYLNRAKIPYVILDEQDKSGGAWLHTWRSLRLFSPPEFSSLPGWLFPKSAEKYPTRDEVIAYLSAYETRYELPVFHGASVKSVTSSTDGLKVQTSSSILQARAVISCTGNWKKPFIPDYPGRMDFKGQQFHSANYVGPEELIGKRVLIVGGGNSGAQILAEVSKQAECTWVTEREPVFLPDDVDGRVLFQVATQRYQAAQEGRSPQSVLSLGDIVMIDSVKEARDRGVLKTVRPFSKIIPEGAVWPNGDEKHFDTTIWCTGFRPALDHLSSLEIFNGIGRIDVDGTRSVKEPRLWLVGYGEWTGFGSATLIGSQRYARGTVAEVSEYLKGHADLRP